MGKKGPLWWRESDWLLRGSSAAKNSGHISSTRDAKYLQNVTNVHKYLTKSVTDPELSNKTIHPILHDM